MADGKYFSNSSKDEIFELRIALNSDKKKKQCDAMKKILASSIHGKEMSDLFLDVVNCMQTDNMELKKLVYLYVKDYSKSNPDMVIMAVNTFLKDFNDPNPFIRGLALRTMGSIKIERITEHLCEPLHKCLADKDPYVRKIAVICVGQLFNNNFKLALDQGFLEQLMEILSDSNAMVVSNTVAVLSEINEANTTGSHLFEMDSKIINKLLSALNECTEWGKIFIIDSLANYSPKDYLETQSICERLTSQLAHINSGVVLSTIKVLIKLMEILPADSDFVTMLTNKLTQPLVNLLSTNSQIQYVVLRIINLLLQKRPDILKREIKMFFVKYNDPIYIKLEKLDIIIRLVSRDNIPQIITELKEYATEIDVDFVRKAVRAIGRCAIKIEESTERCVSLLMDLIQTKVNYVVQEAIIVIKDIFRKYPNEYESIIVLLCENLDTLDEPEAKASMIWIIGEYAERIENADELLESFLEGFHDEIAQVKLQILTAIVKLFLKLPNKTPDLVQKVLKMATQESDNPDIRDRGFIYWRLLSNDPVAAKNIVLAEKLPITEETDVLESTLLDELTSLIPSLASIYQKPPSTFLDIQQKPSLSAGNKNTSINHVSQSENLPASQELITGDLICMDGTTPAIVPTSDQPQTVDLLTFEVDSLLIKSDISTVSTCEDLHDSLLPMDLITPVVVPSSVRPPSVDSHASELNPFLTTSDITMNEDLNTVFFNMDLTTPAIVPTSDQPQTVDLLTFEVDSLLIKSDISTVSTCEDLHDSLLHVDLITPVVVPTSVQPPSVDLRASELNPFLTTSDTTMNEDLNTVFFNMDLTTPANISTPQPLSVDLNAPGLNPFMTSSDITLSSNENSLFFSTDLENPAVDPISVQLPSLDVQASRVDLLMCKSDLPTMSISNTGLFSDLIEFMSTSVSYSPPKTLWLASENGRGLEIMGTFSRKNDQINMDITFKNKTKQPMTKFAIQFKSNFFGLKPVHPLEVLSILYPETSIEISLPLKTTGSIEEKIIEHITNLQVAIKNNNGIVYYACVVPINVFFVNDGKMDKQVFFTTWENIPAQNEMQFILENVTYNTETIIIKMTENNIFTIAKMNIEDQKMIYLSLQLTNGLWVLSELKIQPGNPNITLLLKSQELKIGPIGEVFQAYDAILH